MKLLIYVDVLYNNFLGLILDNVVFENVCLDVLEGNRDLCGSNVM